MSCILDQRESRRASWPSHCFVISLPPIAVDGCWLTYLCTHNRIKQPADVAGVLDGPPTPSESEGPICLTPGIPHGIAGMGVKLDRPAFRKDRHTTVPWSLDGAWDFARRGKLPSCMVGGLRLRVRH